MTPGRWGPPRSRGEERLLLLPAGYEAGRLSRGSRPLRPGRGKVCSDDAEDPLLHAVRQLGHVLRDRVAALLERVDGLLQVAAALAQFALDADAGFADLALEPVAGRGAAALEAAQLGLGLRRRAVAGDRVAGGRDNPVAGDQGGADGDQHGALGVVAEHIDGVTRRDFGLAHGRLGLVDRAWRGGFRLR